MNTCISSNPPQKKKDASPETGEAVRKLLTKENSSVMSSQWVTWTEYWRSTHWPRRSRDDQVVYYPRWFYDQKTYDDQICEQCGGVPRQWKEALRISHVHRESTTGKTRGHETCTSFLFERYTSDPCYPFDPPTEK